MTAADPYSYSTASSANSSTWERWSSTGTTTTSASGTWGNWVQTGGNSDTAGTTSNTTISNSYIWGVWCTGSGHMQITDGSIMEDSSWSIWCHDGTVHVREHSEDERQEINRQSELESQSRYEKQHKEKENAERRAKELLLDLIGEKELKIYDKTGRLFVRGKEFDYIIPKEGFVQRIAKDKVTDLCIHLQDRHKFPDTDNVISLKLLAEADEEGFNKLANVHHSSSRPEKLLECACMGN